MTILLFLNKHQFSSWSKGGKVTLPNVTASHSLLAMKKTAATFDLTVRVLLSENRPVVILLSSISL